MKTNYLTNESVAKLLEIKRAQLAEIELFTMLYPNRPNEVKSADFEVYAALIEQVNSLENVQKEIFNEKDRRIFTPNITPERRLK